MKVGVLASMVFALLIGLPAASMAGLAPDADGDGIPDALDNCDKVANSGSLFCDTDQDGYGNRCDCDLNNNGACTTQDFSLWRQAFQSGANLAADHNCSGTITTQDFSIWRQLFQNPSLFSSGLSCAGTIPCN